MRLWLPDIPGTLGRVAAAIGEAHGDVVGIEILERGAGMAIDELTVTLDEEHGVMIDQLIAQVGQVPGVAIEDVHLVAHDRPEHSVLALETAARILETPPAVRTEATCELVRSMLDAQWSVIVPRGHSVPLAMSGAVPDLSWVVAFLGGISHLPSDAEHEHTPADMAWAPLGLMDAAIVVGRQRGAFRLRERQHLTLIARIVGSTMIDDDR